MLKKDFMVWILCVALFLCGVIWGSIKLRSDFYSVASIHDLFEILSSAATVVAVVFGLNAWRNQIKGESDHGLARRLAVLIMKHKETIKNAHNECRFAVNNCIVGFDQLPQDLLRQVTNAACGRMSKAMDERAELLAALLEARALWGDEVANSLSEFCDSVNLLYGPVRLFNAAIDPELQIENKDAFKERVVIVGERLEAEGWSDVNIDSKVENIARRASEIIKEKLLV